jgi:hypothetical protein
MQKLLISLASLAFVGCSSTHMSSSRDHEPISKVLVNSRGELVPAHLSQVSVGSTAVLQVANIWPLQNKGSYLQKITASAMGKRHSFSVHLTLDDDMLEAIAFADMAGRLYSMKWTPESVHWEGSSYIPPMIKPENIIADFLLVHLPTEQLHSVLQGAQIFEQDANNGKTRIVKGREVIRKITCRNPIGNIWGYVVIENPIIGYKLEIQTVMQ